MGDAKKIGFVYQEENMTSFKQTMADGEGELVGHVHVSNHPNGNAKRYEIFILVRSWRGALGITMEINESLQMTMPHNKNAERKKYLLAFDRTAPSDFTLCDYKFEYWAEENPQNCRAGMSLNPPEKTPLLCTK